MDEKMGPIYEAFVRVGFLPVDAARIAKKTEGNYLLGFYAVSWVQAALKVRDKNIARCVIAELFAEEKKITLGKMNGILQGVQLPEISLRGHTKNNRRIILATALEILQLDFPENFYLGKYVQ